MIKSTAYHYNRILTTDIRKLMNREELLQQMIQGYNNVNSHIERTGRIIGAAAQRMEDNLIDKARQSEYIQKFSDDVNEREEELKAVNAEAIAATSADYERVKGPGM